MADIRLVGLDLDGTLLNDEKKISAATMQALEEAAARGVHLVPCTGRPHLGVPSLVRALPFVQYLISCNGACTWDQKNDCLLREQLVPRERSRALVELLQGSGASFEVLYEGVGYAEKWVYEALIARNPQSPFLPRYIAETRKIIPSMRAFVQEIRGLEEIFVMGSSLEQLQQLQAGIAALGGLHVVLPAPGMLEITACDVDKGNALLDLAQSLGLAREQVMAIGDSGNDLAMLRAAGLSVAMGQAPTEIRRVADAVTGTNEEDGVAMALQRFVLT